MVILKVNAKHPLNIEISVIFLAVMVDCEILKHDDEEEEMGNRNNERIVFAVLLLDLVSAGCFLDGHLVVCYRTYEARNA